MIREYIAKFIKINSIARRFWIYTFFSALISSSTWVLTVKTELPIINIDGLFLLTFSIWSSCLGAFVALVSMTVGIAAAVSEILGYKYLVHSVPAFLSNLPFMPALVKIAFYGLVTLLVVVSIFIFKAGFAEAAILSGKRKFKICIYLCAVIVCALFYFLEKNNGSNLFGSYLLTHRQQLHWLITATSTINIAENFQKVELPGRIGSIEQAVKEKQDIILVIVESMGEFEDEILEEYYEKIINNKNLKNKYNISKYHHPSEGSTVFGEIRELCGLKLINEMFIEPPKECIPEVLKSSGYVTSAIHGNDAKFYRRNIWYPAIGFEEIIDIHRLPNSDLNKCGGLWDAYCDIDLFNLSLITESRADPQFIYILTINTHLPAVAMSKGLVSTEKCNEAYTEQVCIYMKNLERVLNAVADMAIKRVNSTIIITGDHPPPFLLRSEQELFVKNTVPFYVLKNKNGIPD